jgi:hypothetical protein
MGLARDFRAACEWLGDDAMAMAAPTFQRQPESERRTPDWPKLTWQRDAREIVDAAIIALDSEEGERGRQYLQGRGIQLEAWRAWRLGYRLQYCPNLSKRRPAIVMPWQGRGTVKAIQYRFIDALDNADRFFARKGGECTLFGIDLVSQRPALVMVEGEINAVSIWQAAGDLVDVVSFGSEDNIAGMAPMGTRLAARYQTVIVWADKPDKALEAGRAIGRGMPMRSPLQDGRKLDANDLLQVGSLRDLLSEVLARAVGERIQQ